MRKIDMILLIPVLIFISCEKKDVPYILPPPGDVEMLQVNMGEDYSTQIYFKFSDKQIYSNHVNDWDLEFETGPNDYLIRMNGGKQVQVFNTGETDFTKTYATTGISWQWDSPDGNPDSIAFRDWYNAGNASSNNYVYLVDRGPDVLAERYKKMQLTEVNQDHYTFVFANPDGSSATHFIMEKDTEHSYIYFSFQNGGQQRNIDPGKTNYDILFTRYRYIYYDLIPFLPYSVNGVLINPFNTCASVDSITPFDSIDFEFTKSMAFTTKYDAIGFDWKHYNFTSLLYEVNNKKCYVIKNHEGIYYKMRFIDFYDDHGIKGAPKFEFQRL